VGWKFNCSGGTLVGTVHLPNAQQAQGGILFLEDVNEHPYRIERMLMQLLDAGVLAKQAAILLGGFSATAYTKTIRATLLSVLLMRFVNVCQWRFQY